MTNRLAAATSPYLLQHAANPVDWWPWCAEAFEEARRRDVPVLISVGYAACHWCHVMAHESFEDDETARLLNAMFVAVKVDREERPDVDAVYMEATVAMSGQGGWPMTVLATPDGAPFFAATYLPRAAFRELLRRGSSAWSERRADVVAQGRAIADALARPRQPVTGRLDTGAAARTLLAGLDPVNGGFGGAPKFPPSACLEFLLRFAAGHAGSESAAAALAAVQLTGESMARGGIYDQLDGGFARYSVDARWVVPHFEKMLYDNAQLMRVYAHLWRATGSPLARRVALETADWTLAELRTPEGGFASSLDADSGGGEGLFYVWRPDELAAVLGPARGRAAAEIFAVSEDGTFEGGSSVLQLPADPPDLQEFAGLRRELAAARSARPRPARDDKVVAAWNGLAIAGLAECALLFDRPDLLAAAEEAAGFVTRAHLGSGPLRRTSRHGAAGSSRGVLEDHADLAEGLLALHQADGDPRWLELAGALLDTVLGRFGAPDGGLYDTADDAEQLLRRPRDPEDNAAPSGTSAAAGALLSYAALTGSTVHREAAERVLATLAGLVSAHPRFAGWAAATAEALAAGPAEVAVVGRADLARLARLGCAPGAVVVTGGSSPLLAGRPPGAAYVCRTFVCEAPTTDPDVLRRQLAVRPDAA